MSILVFNLNKSNFSILTLPFPHSLPTSPHLSSFYLVHLTPPARVPGPLVYCSEHSSDPQSSSSTRLSWLATVAGSTTGNRNDNPIQSNIYIILLHFSPGRPAVCTTTPGREATGFSSTAQFHTSSRYRGRNPLWSILIRMILFRLDFMISNHDSV